MNITVLNEDLAKKKDAVASLLTAQMTAADKDGNRARTPEEVAAVETLLVEARGIQTRITAAENDQRTLAEIGRLTGGTIVRPATADVDKEAKRELRSMGQQFVESDSYDFFRKGRHRASSAWTSPSTELNATTITEGGGSGGPLIMPQVLPGIQPLAMFPLMMASILAGGTTDSNAIIYMQELAFTNAAAPVAEGAAKPESVLSFVQKTDTVTKLAHWLPVTEEMLEDVAAIRSYIDARLLRGLAMTEDDQLLNGSGIAPALLGLLARAGLTAAHARGADTNIDALLKQASIIATTAFIQPTAFVLNPANWLTVQLSKNTVGNYMGAGPWAPPQSATLWGLPVVQSAAMTAGSGLVGDFAGSAQIFRKGGIRVEASNSHNDFFVKNLIAIRAEERLALAVYRPAAFGTVTGLN